MKLIYCIFLLFAVPFVPQKKKRVIFFGDSITQQGVDPGGYIARIDSMCKLENKSAGFEFIGSGIGGNKVYDLYLRLDDDVLSKNPDIVVIYIGVNDVWHKTSFGTGTDPDKFEVFYNAILKKLKEKNIRAILCTPAVIGERTDFSNPQDGDMNRYSGIIRSIAQKNSLPLVDLRQKFLDYNKQHNTENKESGVLTRDRVHLNSKGNQLVADEIWHAISNL
ncbi:MAG TPA: SGNH/GDSL hydrolase family protein [Chitinophagaceae bacterium]|nr:SGNH/GDSL hydrolase family protein [Chitinophagaceae bacterium]